MIDSHAHLYFDKFDPDREEVIARARQAGVSAIINIGIDVATTGQAIALAKSHEGFHASAGIHPTSKSDDIERDVAQLRALIAGSSRQVIAVGEIGLDYYWKDVSAEDQKKRLRLQLDLARELGLPVIFHCRDALEGLLSILESERALPPGVFHCFSGGARDAERALALGFHLSFAGNVTYPKSVDLHVALGAAPIEKLLLETDCPFLAPQPVRGKRNEPAFVRHTRDFIAAAKKIAPEELERATDATTRRLFRLP